VVDCASFAQPQLQALSAAFAAEDARVGVLPRDGPAGGAAGTASLLLNGELHQGFVDLDGLLLTLISS
jgi:hypothetical protein